MSHLSTEEGAVRTGTTQLAILVIFVFILLISNICIISEKKLQTPDKLVKTTKEKQFTMNSDSKSYGNHVSCFYMIYMSI
jgi:hypothetical protein